VKFALERKPISYAELMAEAGFSVAVPATRQKSRAFAINPPKTKPEPISFDKLMTESKNTAPQPITFSQLQSEAAETRAI
jgi:hypothetical protein